jgi:ribosomal protein S18 acetylase RimI-like enzyme
VRSDSVVVRTGRIDDRGFVAELGRRTIDDSVAKFRYFNHTMVLASFDALLEFVYSQPHVTFIAEREAVRAGFALLLTAMPDEVTRMPQGFIAYMAVEPSARRYGIGNHLLAAAEQEARRLGLPYMGLMVTEDNAAARALYEHSGYVTERRLLCKPL